MDLIAAIEDLQGRVTAIEARSQRTRRKGVALNPTERRTLLQIVRVAVLVAYGRDAIGHPYKTAEELLRDGASFGATTMSARTVADKIQEAGQLAGKD
jgi:hypothetical protein